MQIKSSNTGLGVFAITPIKKGTLVHPMGGVKMSSSAVVRAIEAGSMCIDDPFQISEDRFLKLDRLSYTFNHSCDPNVGVSRRWGLVALRDIPKGQQITYDYSTTVCSHCEWHMKCACGFAVCRKVIRNVLSIPKKRRVWLATARMLPLYIAREL